jgi:hypothetical protein
LPTKYVTNRKACDIQGIVTDFVRALNTKMSVKNKRF